MVALHKLTVVMPVEHRVKASDGEARLRSDACAREGQGARLGDEAEEEATQRRLKLYLVLKFLAFPESSCLTFPEYLRFTQRLDGARVSPGGAPLARPRSHHTGELPSNELPLQDEQRILGSPGRRQTCLARFCSKP